MALLVALLTTSSTSHEHVTHSNKSIVLHKDVQVALEDGELGVTARAGATNGLAMAGTMRSLLNNLVVGVSEGFTKKLELRGVGYRAQAQGSNLNLTLGFSHPVVHKIPDGIKVETPSQTEIVVSGSDKQVVGQVAADIRSYRPPEPGSEEEVMMLLFARMQSELVQPAGFQA